MIYTEQSIQVSKLIILKNTNVFTYYHAIEKQNVLNFFILFIWPKENIHFKFYISNQIFSEIKINSIH